MPELRPLREDGVPGAYDVVGEAFADLERRLQRRTGPTSTRSPRAAASS